MTDNKETVKQIQDLINKLPKEDAISLLDQELRKLKEPQNHSSYSAYNTNTSSQNRVVTPKQTSYGTKAFNTNGIQTK